MQALVTGATGFLGSHIVARLLAAGHQVRGLCRSPAKRDALVKLGAEPISGDVTDVSSLLTATQNVDVVYHAAALVTQWGPWSEFERVTVGGTENLLQAATRAGVRRFVQISTIRVYDDRYCKQHRVVDEEAPTGTHGFRHFGHYARSKLLAEQTARRHHESGGVPVTILRPAWIYGPGDTNIVPGVLRFLQSRFPRWPSRNDPCADPIFVEDVADCAIAATLSDRAVGHTYNVAPAEEISLRQFIGAIALRMGIPLPRRSLPYFVPATVATFAETWARLTRRVTPPTATWAGLAVLTQDVRHDPSKAERDFGWRSQVSLEEGTRRTAEMLLAVK